MPETTIAAKIRVADVALDSRSGGAEAIFTYAVPESAEVGDAVIAPLGNRAILGFIRQTDVRSEEQLGYSLEKLKSIDGRIDGLSLPKPVIDLVEFVASEYLCPFSVALSAAMPPNAADQLVETWNLIDGESAPFELTPLQVEIFDTAKQHGSIRFGAKTKPQPAYRRALGALSAKGLLERRTAFVPMADARTAPPLFRPTPDSQKIDDFLKAHAKKRPAQALVLLKLREIENAALAVADIKGLCGVTETTVKQLVTAGLLEQVEGSGAKVAKPPVPNAAQQLAIDAIVESIRERESQSFLLFGVTGSGKTEVYLRAAAEAIRLGRQVLYLTPEIALATMAVKLLRARFGKSVAILHSDLPAAERTANWASIRSGESAIVLGARSALFAPLGDIGLIIVDEEHESSYKQESSPRYHAKRLAQFLSERHRCPLVLGSATPSFETFYEAENDVHRMFSLPGRAAAATMPEVWIDDLGESYRQNRPAILGELLHGKLEATLQRGEQAILFLNRRSYAPFLICRDCGKQFLCPNCSVSLAFSRKLGRLRCHHCGHSELPPSTCPQCEGTRVNPFGIGAERVEEHVSQYFPQARVARLDRDIAQRKGALESILAAFGAGEIDVLVGTQMVAKGLDFPGVTLVGVIAADTSLNLPDFRAAERTFQLLSQVAGRAGRGSKHGEVVIQTFNPEHVAIVAASNHRFIEAFEALFEERREAGYPPFHRLVNVLFSGTDAEDVRTAAMYWAKSMSEADLPEVEVLGPTDCAIERLNKRWRMHALVKIPWSLPTSAMAPSLEAAKREGVQIIADVDPYSML